jgi:hypothetical protein
VRLRALGILWLALAVGSCSSYKPTPTSFKLPRGDQAVEVFGARVSVKAYDDPKEAKQAFQGFDIRAAGLLPVQVVVQNDGPYTLRMNPAQTFVEDANEDLWPVMEKKLAYDRVAKYADTNAAFKEGAHKGFMGAVAGALVGAAIGVVSSGSIGGAAAKGAAVGGAGGAVIGGASASSSGNARREAIEDLRQKELENKVIAPGSLVYGFVFFPGEVEDATLLRLQFRIADTSRADTIEFSL